MDKKHTWIFLGVSLVIILICFIGLDAAFKPLLFAWVLSYFCLPLFDKLESFGVSREISSFVILLILLVIILSVIFIFIPNLVVELQYFLEDFPQLVVNVSKNIVTFAASNGIDINIDDFSLLSFMKSHMPNVSAKSLVWVGSAFQSAISNVIYTVLSIISIFLFPVFFFYVSISHKDINNVVSSWLPERYLRSFAKAENAIDDVMGGFLRGQVVISSILACYYSLSLSIISLPFGGVIGVFTGFLSLIPYVGFSLGLFSSLIVALATGVGFFVIASIGVIFLIAYISDSFFMTPKLVGSSVGLNPLSVMIALIVGGNLFGLWGMFFAIPVAALVKRYYSFYKDDFVHSDWFLKGN
jgi:predicted PurR-regulated permease PerM